MDFGGGRCLELKEERLSVVTVPMILNRASNMVFDIRKTEVGNPALLRDLGRLT